MQYKTLADCSLFAPGTFIEIWYARKFATMEFDRNDPRKTHELVGTIQGYYDKERQEAPQEELLAHLFSDMQGEIWSPNGEARELIFAAGTDHTSMSIGDIVRFIHPTHDEWQMVLPVGWKRF